jgi:hypothetical protein
MATLGGREIRKKKRSGQPTEGGNIAAPSVNLIAAPAVIQPVSIVDVQPSSFGGPIMREDFVTRTGIMLPKSDLEA